MYRFFLNMIFLNLYFKAKIMFSNFFKSIPIKVGSKKDVHYHTTI